MSSRFLVRHRYLLNFLSDIAIFGLPQDTRRFLGMLVSWGKGSRFCGQARQPVDRSASVDAIDIVPMLGRCAWP